MVAPAVLLLLAVPHRPGDPGVRPVVHERAADLARTRPRFIGLDNFIRAFTADPRSSTRC